MNKRWDYDRLERQYVQGDMSLRELAASVGMSNHSLMMRQSKKREWPRKRQEFREQAAKTALTVMAGSEGRHIVQEERVREHIIDTIDRMVLRLQGDLEKTKTVVRDGHVVEEPLVRVTPQTLIALIDKVNVLFGRPSSITEDRNLGVHLESADPQLLRDFVEATRGIGLDAGPTAASPLPVAPKARED